MGGTVGGEGGHCWGGTDGHCQGRNCRDSTVGGTLSGVGVQSSWKTHLALSYKVENVQVYGPCILLLGIYSGKTHVHWEVCITLFTIESE